MGNGIDWDPSHSSVGQAVSNINWDPRQSTLGQGITEASKSWDFNPYNSTAGQALQGNWGEAARGIQGAFNRQDPMQQVAGYAQGQIAEGQAAQKRAFDEKASADAAEAAKKAAAEKNASYLSSQATANEALGAEDAFTAARNAARKAKGTQLFGAYNG